MFWYGIEVGDETIRNLWRSVRERVVSIKDVERYFEDELQSSHSPLEDAFLLSGRTSKQSPEPVIQQLYCYSSNFSLSYLTHSRNLCVCVYILTVSLKLSESQRFLNTATTEEGGLSRSSKASIRIKSNTMSKKFIHTTCRHDNHNTVFNVTVLPVTTEYKCTHVIKNTTATEQKTPKHCPLHYRCLHHVSFMKESFYSEFVNPWSYSTALFHRGQHYCSKYHKVTSSTSKLWLQCVPKIELYKHE